METERAGEERLLPPTLPLILKPQPSKCPGQRASPARLHLSKAPRAANSPASHSASLTSLHRDIKSLSSANPTPPLAPPRDAPCGLPGAVLYPDLDAACLRIFPSEDSSSGSL